MKKDLQIKARNLRKEGYSINELQKILGVSKSSISLWVRSVPLSEKAQVRLNKNYTNGQLASQKVIKGKTQQKNLDADLFAKRVLDKMSITKQNEIILCSMIYHCEGSKSIKDSVTFTNSDPSLIQTFLYLFRKSFEIDEGKLRVLMHLHDYHNEIKQKHFWSKITKIPIERFLKTFNKDNTGLYKKENYQGCIQIRYHDVSIGRKLHAVAKRFMERYK